MLEGGARGRAAVPSGASTGEREALELRDGDTKRYLGKGVRKRRRPRQRRDRRALAARELSQRELDEAMIALDGTRDQEPARRQRAARRLDGGAQGRRRRARPAALRARRARSPATTAATCCRCR